LINELKRLLYTAETSCYWYWTGQEIWDRQVTQATNQAIDKTQKLINQLVKSKRDKTGPTIFVPWVRPANPGGQDWGPGGLVQAAKEATFRTFIYDISGLKKVCLHYHNAQDSNRKTEKQINMKNCGPYPSRTNPSIIATQYQVILPASTGHIYYFVEAVDNQDNISFSPVGQIYLA
jgi:hypothetical protein